jgi:DNA-binding NtrC family response regulator
MKNREVIIEKSTIPPTLEQMVSPLRVLVVDDDIYVRELNAGVLLRSGYKVDTAEDGADAWKALNDHRYDLLITDNKMPRLTGLELIQKLRSENMMLPVILASGVLPLEELKQHPELRLDAVLAKPFTLPELLDAVKKVLPQADSAIESSELFRRCALKDDKIPQAKASAIAPVQNQTNSYRILVVDDDNDVRQLSLDVLANSGYEVEGVNDGAAGWEALQADNYDLVVTDNKMPRMTGLEMIEKLRSARMELRVIMATGVLPAHEFARKPWLKPDATLQRPFTNDDLLATVKKVLHEDDGGDDHNQTLLPKYL